MLKPAVDHVQDLAIELLAALCVDGRLGIAAVQALHDPGGHHPVEDITADLDGHLGVRVLFHLEGHPEGRPGVRGELPGALPGTPALRADEDEIDGIGNELGACFGADLVEEKAAHVGVQFPGDPADQ